MPQETESLETESAHEFELVSVKESAQGAVQAYEELVKELVPAQANQEPAQGTELSQETELAQKTEPKA